MTETKQINCESADCTSGAVAQIFWPGRKPMAMCQQHVDGAATIGQAMGCYIHIEALPNFTKCEVSNIYPKTDA